MPWVGGPAWLYPMAPCALGGTFIELLGGMLGGWLGPGPCMGMWLGPSKRTQKTCSNQHKMIPLLCLALGADMATRRSTAAILKLVKICQEWNFHTYDSEDTPHPKSTMRS